MSSIGNLYFESRCQGDFFRPDDDFLNDLPKKIIKEIFNKLNGLSLVTCKRTCKKIHKHVQNINSYQKKIDRAEFGIKSLIIRENFPGKEHLLLAAIPLVAEQNIQEAIAMLNQAKEIMTISGVPTAYHILLYAEMAVARAFIDTGNVKAGTDRTDSIIPSEKCNFRKDLAFYLVEKGYINEAQEFVKAPEILRAVGQYLVENGRIEEAVVLYNNSTLNLESLFNTLPVYGKVDLAREVSQKIAIIAAKEGFTFNDPEELIQRGFYINMLSIDEEKALEFFLTKQDGNLLECLRTALDTCIRKGKVYKAEEIAKKMVELDPESYSLITVEAAIWAASIHECIIKGDLDVAQEKANSSPSNDWMDNEWIDKVEESICKALIEKGGDSLNAAFIWAKRGDLRIKVAQAYP